MATDAPQTDRLDEARALTMLRAGRPPLAVARALRVRSGRVVALADRLGVPHSVHPAFSREDEARALDMVRAGRSAQEIARDLCASTQKVYALLRLLCAPTPTDAALRARPARPAARRPKAPTFVCARCGETFAVGEADFTDEGCAGRVRSRRRGVPASPFVTIGGRPWCERCAAARYPRRFDPDCALGADAVEWISHCKRGLVDGSGNR